MSIEDYRRSLKNQVRAAAADAEGAGLGELEIRAAADALPDADDPGQVLEDLVREKGASPRVRGAAFTRLVSRVDGDERAVERAVKALADADEHPKVRRRALRSLKQRSFSDPGFAEWRADYLDALRAATASGDDRLVLQAYEVLSHLRDRDTQEALVAGLEDPSKARVPALQALRLLTNDPHTRAAQVARRLVRDSEDEAVREQAVRLLGNDAQAADVLGQLVRDGSQSPRVRRSAATALGGLRPEALTEVDADGVVGQHLASLRRGGDEGTA